VIGGQSVTVGVMRCQLNHRSKYDMFVLLSNRCSVQTMFPIQFAELV
jgi:hypothetical protein